MNYRPDLVDWKKVEKRHVRERIDQAFHIMEKEYGVTRLLDPEGKMLFYTYESSFTAKTQLEKCELLAKKKLMLNIKYLKLFSYHQLSGLKGVN